MRGLCFFIGGIKERGKVVAGPEDSEARPIVPLVSELPGVHEIVGVGTLFPDEAGTPTLHLHAALGRAGKTITGCTRKGIETWQLGEAILLEIMDNTAYRKKDPTLGFDIMEP